MHYFKELLPEKDKFDDFSSGRISQGMGKAKKAALILPPPLVF